MPYNEDEALLCNDCQLPHAVCACEEDGYLHDQMVATEFELGLNNLRPEHPKVAFDIAIEGNYADLNFLEATEAGAGHGSAFMAALGRLADRCNVEIVVDPAETAGRPVLDFYGRFNFIDYRDGLMIRIPRLGVNSTKTAVSSASGSVVA